MLTDDIDYYTRLNELIFAQGVVGEYLFLKGAIDDAYMWDKKYNDDILNFNNPRDAFAVAQLYMGYDLNSSCHRNFEVPSDNITHLNVVNEGSFLKKR